MSFTAADWAIVVLYVLFAFGIGFLVRKYVSSVADLLSQFGIGWAVHLVESFPSIGKRGLCSFALGFVGTGLGSLLPISTPKLLHYPDEESSAGSPE